MIKFTNKHNCIFGEEALSNAIEWYAGLRGIQVWTQKSIFIDSHGYLRVSIGDGCVRVSRLLMMHRLGRELKSDEWVHHRDGNKLNNVLSNLKLMSDVEHGVHHRKRADIQDAVIEEMLTQGISQWDIAMHFGCSSAAIHHRVKRIRGGG